MGSNPSKFKGANRPVECVSWFISINSKGLEPACINGDMDVTGMPKGIDCQAEWGVQCSVSNTQEAQCMKSLGNDNSGSETHPVGLKKPNGFGLYDMSGNVYEWVWDKVELHGVCHHNGQIVRRPYWSGPPWSSLGLSTNATTIWVFVSRGPFSKPSIIGQIVAISEVSGRNCWLNSKGNGSRTPRKTVTYSTQSQESQHEHLSQNVEPSQRSNRFPMRASTCWAPM